MFSTPPSSSNSSEVNRSATRGRVFDTVTMPGSSESVTDTTTSRVSSGIAAWLRPMTSTS